MNVSCCAVVAQVYNVDNSTASPSVLLFFDKQRYLFNAGEGIQRHLIEYKQRLQKVGPHSTICAHLFRISCCLVSLSPHTAVTPSCCVFYV